MRVPDWDLELEMRKAAVATLSEAAGTREIFREFWHRRDATQTSLITDLDVWCEVRRREVAVIPRVSWADGPPV